MFLTKIKPGDPSKSDQGRISFRGVKQENIDWLRKKAKSLNLKYNDFLNQIITQLRAEEEGTETPVKKEVPNESLKRSHRPGTTKLRKKNALRAGH
jgi:hypothetical protein